MRIEEHHPTGTGRRRLRLVSGLALVLALGLTACGGGQSGGGGDDAVVFGAATELSGALQLYGVPVKQGLEAGAAALNEDGGIDVGGTKHKAAVAVADNRSDPSVVATAARQVMDDGAIAALGPDISAKVAYDLWKANDVITFTPDFGLQVELQDDPAAHPLLFSPIPFLNRLYERDMRQIAERFPNIKRVAILSTSNDEGRGAAAAYADGAKRAGMTVVDNELYPDGTTDFSSLLTSAKAASPDLLIALQSPEQAATILRQADQLGVAPYGLNDAITPDQVTGSISGITVIIPNFAPTYSKEATIPDYDPKAVFGNGPIPLVPGAAIDMYYAYRLLAQAVDKAGTTTDAAAIARALPGQSHDGPFGRCTMSKERELQCETLLQVVHGQTIDVLRYAEPDATQPMKAYRCRASRCVASSSAG